MYDLTTHLKSALRAALPRVGIRFIVQFPVPSARRAGDHATPERSLTEAAPTGGD